MNFLNINKIRTDRMNNSEIKLFVKNYKMIISNNSEPNNSNNKKILTIMACHTNSIIKYNTIINNIPYLIFPNNDIIIINSSNEKYSDKLKKYISTKSTINAPNNKIIKYFEIPNDKYIDIGKYIYVLNTMQTDDSFSKEYEFVVLINDSIIIKKSIRHFYNMTIKKNKELYAYNDSSEIKYHYQSYLYAIKYNVIHKLIDYFNNHKFEIHGYNDVIDKIELELNTVYANDNDCFLKIAKLPCNLNKNIYFHNDNLYKLLFSNEILPFIKIRTLEQKDNNMSTLVNRHMNTALNV
jgi:cupin superfamily acireductone dioxygenase involved in methionine salvage